jgi:hypothetical protein
MKQKQSLGHTQPFLSYVKSGSQHLDRANVPIFTMRTVVHILIRLSQGTTDRNDRVSHHTSIFFFRQLQKQVKWHEPLAYIA